MRAAKKVELSFPHLAPSAAAFIRALRRRFTLVRIAESIALSCFAASIAAILLVLIALYLAKPAMTFALACLAIACGFGLLWGLSRRPTLLEAALEADRQLNLDDLLGTLLMSTRRDPWFTAFAAYAEARCRALHPSAVIVHRFGLRAWTGITLLAALLMTLASLTTLPTGAVAATNLANRPNTSPAPANRSFATADLSPQPLFRNPGPGGVDQPSYPDVPQDQPDDLANASTPRQSDDAAARDSHPSTNSAGPGNAATTASADSPQSLPTSNSAARQINPATAIPRSGGGAPSEFQPRGILPTTGTLPSNTSPVASQNPHYDAPHYDFSPQSTDPAANSTATSAPITAGRVPDADADLVREFFKQ